MNDWLYILLGLLAALFLVLVYISIRYVNRILYPKTRTYESAKEKIRRQGYFPEAYLESLTYNEFRIPSPYGYLLYGRVYPAPSKNFVILVHGITMNIYGALKYLPFFYSKGFNVVVFDLRNHGQTGGPNTTYGHFEKWDLSAVTDYLYTTYGQDIHIGVHGESMGGAISILHMGMDPRVEFGIIDCAFSDLSELLLLKLKQDSGIKSKKLLQLVNQFIKSKSGFSIEDVSPVKEVPSIKKPILFIHGTQDTYIPPMMAKAMYAFKVENKFLYLAEGGEHSTAMAVDPQRYDEEITRFLNIVYPRMHFTPGNLPPS
ncbi:alpha/beta fold hydrolase [Proteiniclasticum sp. BAD-10]|uniref:Alpha/beta fold hydrolase n=1 Tax=Proteiniclasticum sediminis TaxID=2804028 RepID=A0A941CN27_9CLOT|nr:alpha/beta fold hydrolase [Proteiniclasticum sediminis]MBR0574718.1 alpha/beta fold hydrolase [Proteiniclasticum sediminis]